MTPRPPISPLFPYTTLFRSVSKVRGRGVLRHALFFVPDLLSPCRSDSSNASAIDRRAVRRIAEPLQESLSREKDRSGKISIAGPLEESLAQDKHRRDKIRIAASLEESQRQNKNRCEKISIAEPG